MTHHADVLELLSTGDLEVEGRLWDSSNSAVRVLCRDGGDSVRAVYKPLRGESPLWDFARGTLGRREVATAIVDEHLEWRCVPPTVWREDGPLGPGSLQAWVDADQESAPVEVLESTLVKPPWLVIAEGEGARGDHVCLVHEDSAALRRIALLDCIVNNADRKGGHVLRAASGPDPGAVVGIDHGLTFHVEPKLRTVLWGWAGQGIDEWALRDLARLAETWDDLAARLETLLTMAEIVSAHDRLLELLSTGEFPTPDGAWPALPWPAM